MCSRVAMFGKDNLKMTELPNGLKYADVRAAEPMSTSPMFPILVSHYTHLQ